jgi:XTP/dITP diphosphohydrolase
MIKARDMYAFVREPVIADDSGLCIDILNGRPGIYSARFGNRDGVKLSDAERNACVLREFEQAISCGETSAKAHYVCAMVLLVSLDRFFIVQETLEGEITSSGKGANGFGYDPIFYLPEKKCTLAELPDAEKNAISHRGKAAQALLRFLR